MRIRPVSSLNGVIELPGDKSISHRAAMLGAMANGETRISNFALSADCSSTLECLGELGVSIDQNGKEVVVSGVSRKGFQAPQNPLNCGNSGTTMRLMAGILAGQVFDSVLTGDESLRGRPMLRVIQPLAEMGAAIDSDGGRAPLRISGGSELRGGKHVLSVASAQVKSCILLAGLSAKEPVSVIERIPTRDHTERMLEWLGADISRSEISEGTEITVAGRELTARDITVPADISSAAFFIAAAGGLAGSRLTIKNVGLNPSRSAVIDVMKKFGIDITIENTGSSGNEPSGDIVVVGGIAKDVKGPNVISGDVIANLIDEVPILAVLGTQLPGGIKIRGAAELRIKESDRIRSVVENLTRMGAQVEEFPDGLQVAGSQLRGAVIDSFGDHRIAMAFAIAGLFAEGESEIRGHECAAVSFPSFFEVLNAVSA